MKLNLKIRHKLALIMFGLSFLVISLISSVFIIQFDQALKERVLLQLSSVVKLKEFQIENLLNEIKENFRDKCKNPDKQLLENGNYYRRPVTDEQIVIFDSILIELTEDDQIIEFHDLTKAVKANEILIALTMKTEDSVNVLIVNIPEIQQILFERTGLGQTGESYIIGADNYLRTVSRFFPDRKPTSIKVKSKVAARAFNGENGSDLLFDYRGKQVFSAFRKIDIKGLAWVLMTEIDHEEALFPLNKMKQNLIYAFIFSMAFIGFIAFQVARLVVKPIETMEERLNKMADGEFGSEMEEVDRKDEIGQMFDAYNKLVNAFNQTINFAGQIGRGNFEANYEMLGENDRLSNALIQMKNQLRQFKENESALIKENQRSIIDGEEKERARLSQEIHDGLGPLLTSLKIKIQNIPVDAGDKKELIEFLDEIIKETRRISNNLMPSVLKDFGVGEAVENLVSQLNENPKIVIRYINDVRWQTRISYAMHVSIYRIIQEGLHNVLKHAKATEVRLSITEFDEQVSIFLSDNGIGFDKTEISRGNGIRNISERVKLHNGLFKLETDTTGTTLEIEIPFGNEDKDSNS